jgi:hypothetical protein
MKSSERDAAQRGRGNYPHSRRGRPSDIRVDRPVRAREEKIGKSLKSGRKRGLFASSPVQTLSTIAKT